jgi:DNA ligase-1
MPELSEGESVEVTGSSGSKYVLKNVGGVYSCSCPAWRNQSLPIDRRTCKHLRAYRGEAAEQARLDGSLALPAKQPAASKSVPALLLAHAWDNEQDLTGWWMSEKLDGVRAYWDGRQFLSRQGNRFFAPDWFTKGLLSVPLDGELWIDRKRFQKTVSIVRRQDAGQAWEVVRYVVFDAPEPGLPFEGRCRRITQVARLDGCPYVRALQQIRCEGIEHVQQELDRIESFGGEGLMLRQPGSLYVAGRSATLLKVKRFHDAEACVVQHLPGAGRHKGRLGALLVELPDGTRFSVGTGLTDAQREIPPPPGSLITFRFQELTDGGVPRFPSFVRVRADVPAKPVQQSLLETAHAGSP